MNKLFSALALCLFCFGAMAQVKHVVFNIDGVMVQRIPTRNFEVFQNKDQMISVKAEGTAYYYIHPYVSYLVHYFQKRNNFVVHFVTTHERKWAEEVLGKINLPAPIDKSVFSFLDGNDVSKLYAKEDLEKATFDLAKITSDTKNVILITTDDSVVMEKHKKNVLLLPQFYYFEKYQQAQDELNKVKQDQFFPKSEEEWFTEQNKAAYVYYYMRMIGAEKSTNLMESKQGVSLDFGKGVMEGLKVAKFNFEEEILKFKYDTDKKNVTGCWKYKTLEEVYLEKVSLKECLSKYQTRTEFLVDEKLHRVLNCLEVDGSYGARIRELETKQCVKSNKADVKFYWQGEVRVNCAAYYLDSYLITDVDSELCGDYHIVEENGKLTVRAYFMVDGKLQSLLPEVLSLTDWDTVPQSVFNYDSRLIALSLVESIHRRRESDQDNVRPDYDFRNDSSIVMAFPFNLFEKIMSEGFLNQHQTDSSQGYYDPAIRAANENNFLGLKLEAEYKVGRTAANKVRPKFSFLLLTKFRKDMGLTEVDISYGNVYVKFKDLVKERSTFYNGNSFGIKYKPGNVKTFRWKSAEKLKLVDGLEYWEAQIWGELSKENIDYFIVNCPGAVPLVAKDIIKMKSYNIPVYQCQAEYGYGDKRMTFLGRGPEL